MSTAAILSPFEPIDTATALRRLKTDDRGAIMVLGVFLALFLIGALWFLIGIGDMLVFRDKAQEAADAAAFTVTVVHAKGMNLIAALNLLMLVFTAIYLVVGIMRDVAYINWIMACVVPPPVTPPQWANCAAKTVSMNNAQNRWNSTSRMFKTTVEALGTIQTITAYVAPHLGQAAGVSVGKKHVYDNEGFLALSVSASMIPGGDGDAGPGDKAGGAAKIGDVKDAAAGFDFKAMGGSGKLGLPVVKAENSTLCKAIIIELANMINFGSGGKGLLGAVRNLIKGAVVWRYCGGGVNNFLLTALGIWENNVTDSDWWEKKTGPKNMFSPAENGTDWMQTYSFVVTDFKDKNIRQVGMAGYDFTKNSVNGMHFYTAQAEMFFDCGKGWKDEECNGDEDDVSLALYAMNWRTRLVRVRQMNIMGVLGDFFLAKVLNGGLFDSLGKIAKDWLGNQGWVKGAANAAEQIGGKAGADPGFLEKILGTGVDMGVDAVEGALGDAWGGANALPATENYH